VALNVDRHEQDTRRLRTVFTDKQDLAAQRAALIELAWTPSEFTPTTASRDQPLATGSRPGPGRRARRDTVGRCDSTDSLARFQMLGISPIAWCGVGSRWRSARALCTADPMGKMSSTLPLRDSGGPDPIDSEGMRRPRQGETRVAAKSRRTAERAAQNARHRKYSISDLANCSQFSTNCLRTIARTKETHSQTRHGPEVLERGRRVDNGDVALPFKLRIIGD